jgi:hypothetical protein
MKRGFTSPFPRNGSASGNWRWTLTRAVGSALAIALAAGCGGDSKPTVFSNPHPEPAHSHDRGKMMLVDAGPYHAGLTAHLSQKEGNELDVLIETADADPKPVPLPVGRFKATATRAGDRKAYPLEFEPAPKDERAGDPEGTCSHFTAKAPWVRHADRLTVTAALPLDGKPTEVRWAGFDPKKYAHVDE